MIDITAVLLRMPSPIPIFDVVLSQETLPVLQILLAVLHLSVKIYFRLLSIASASSSQIYKTSSSSSSEKSPQHLLRQAAES
jgi:hypothetical protein